MNKTKKIILCILLFILAILINNGVNATSISVSPSTPKKGQAVTITVSVPNVNTVDLSATISGAGTNSEIRLVDGSMTGSAKTFSKSVTVTPTKAGTIKVEVSSGSNAVLNGEYVGVYASKSINVIESNSNSSSGSSGSSNNKPNTSNTNNDDTPKSTDSSLKGLSVEEGAITPEFNKDVKEYTLTVPNEIGGANVTAIPNDSKATVSVTGNVALKEGENTVTILVTAEDGSTSKYLIRVMRERPALSLQSLVIRYKNQEGQLIEIPLNPIFNFETYEYTIEDLEHWVETLEIDAVPNIEGAKIDIQGADNLVQGENTVTITVKVPLENNGELPEGEEPQEEIRTYTIKLNKKEEPVPPTLMGKISNWFNGIFGGVTSWYNNNQEQAILGALAICVVSLLVLSIYIIVDYKKYKILIQKLSKLNDIENDQPLEENIIQNIAQKRIQEKDMSESFDNIEKIKNDRPKGGRHF